MWQEPYRLKEFTSRATPFAGRLFTCARPGRSLGSTKKKIDDEVVLAWVCGLPNCRPLHIVSLLGRKPPPSALSEYSYYSFRGVHELPHIRPQSPTFQEWLDGHFAAGNFMVTDFPTIDLQPIADSNMSEICDRIGKLLDESANVLIVDSGGFTRTGSVCAALRAEAKVPVAEELRCKAKKA